MLVEVYLWMNFSGISLQIVGVFNSDFVKFVALHFVSHSSGATSVSEALCNLYDIVLITVVPGTDPPSE